MSQRAPREPAAAAVSPDETLTALARMLDFAAPGRFVLAFVKCNLPVQRRDLVERIKVLVEPLDVALLELELTGPVDRLLPILRTRLAGSYLIPSLEAEPARDAEHMPALREDRGKFALFVYGLEHSLPSTDRNPPILAHLNLSRELFRRDVPYPLVIWLPDYALTKVAQGAPDFWAWRSGVYEFPPEPETAQRMARMTVYDEAGHITSSLSAEGKRERLRLLARLLDDYRELALSGVEGSRERSTQADILWKMGSVHQELGEWAEARAHYEEALQLAHAPNEPRTAAGMLHQLGRLAQDMGDLAEARRLYDESLDIERELGDRRGIAQTLGQLGLLAQDTGDLAEAHRLYDESLAINRELGDKQGIASTLHNLAMLAQDTRNLTEARRLYDEARHIFDELGAKKEQAAVLHQLGRLAEDEGNVAEAARLFEESLKLLAELGSPDANVAKRSLERVMQRIDNE